MGAGVIASPVLSADGTTVYVNGRDRRLWALDAADGSAKWSVPLGFPAPDPAVGRARWVIIAGGGPNTELVGVRDSGDSAEVAWRRDDITRCPPQSRAGGKVAYTVTADGPDKLSPCWSSTPKTAGAPFNSYPLDGAGGYPVGGLGSPRPPGGGGHQHRPGLQLQPGPRNPREKP